VFQIGAFGRLAGISPKVLRDYDRLGLVRPAWVDPVTGYRRYSPAQLPELRRILALRDLGVGLEAILALVREGRDLGEILARRRGELEAARREIDRQLATLGISMGGGPATPGAEGRLDVVVRRIPSELVATMDPDDVGGDVGRAFYELEARIRDAGARAPRPPGEIADGERTEIFVPVRRAAPGLAIRRLPAIRAATALHRGSYRTMARTEADLERWIAAAGLRPTGSARVLYLQFGAEADLRLPPAYLVERSADLVTELQVPIE
jgi:DNA-binding transcriptional MerR regulator